MRIIWLLLILILLGVGGYYGYARYKVLRQKASPHPPPSSYPSSPPRPSMPVTGRQALARSSASRLRHGAGRASGNYDLFRKRAEEKARQRRSIFERFGPSARQKPGQDKVKIKDIDKKKPSGFLPLSQLADKISPKKQGQNHDRPGRISPFDRLSQIASGKEPSLASAIFSRLSSIGKKGAGKKGEKAVTEKKAAEPENSSHTKKISAYEKSSATSAKPFSPSPIDNLKKSLKQENTPLEQAIRKLSKAGKKKIKNLPEKSSAKDISRLFLSMSKKDMLSDDVFKTLIAHLIKSGKLDRSELSQLLFDLHAQGLISKSGISKVFFELADVKKGSK